MDSHGLKGAKVYGVYGEFDYYHYLQDGMKDAEWGCAYRSLQTICSWFKLQGFTRKPVPTHKKIQQVLVKINDKPKSFIGSNTWIGAIEISLFLDDQYNVQSRILNVSSGSLVEKKVEDIINHFKKEGTPIMIGGGVLAFTILGVAYNEETKEIRYLILDPHYTGKDDPEQIVSKGWCAWKKNSLFLKDHFYNLCLPLRPKLV